MTSRVRTCVALATLAAVAFLGGCTSTEPLADASGNYTSADGAVVEITKDNRTDPIDFTATDTTDGSTISSAMLRGHVTVVNFWYASCPPCRAEADDLASIAGEYADRARFIGVNVYDQSAVATAFEDTFDIPYPSVLDVDTGVVRLAFANDFGPNAVPTTIVLDPDGRVAGRISGRIADPSILTGMIDGVLEEQP